MLGPALPDFDAQRILRTIGFDLLRFLSQQSLTGLFSPYPDQETATRIANIRTDLNRFTQEEFEVLMNHGYLRAAEKMIRYCGDLMAAPPPSPRDVQPPYPKWLDPAATRKALRRSGNRLWPHRWR